MAHDRLTAFSLPRHARAGKLRERVQPDSSVDVTIVLPVLNEAGHLLTELGRIRVAMDAFPYAYEAPVVEDGFTDGGFEELPDLDRVHLAGNDRALDELTP